MVNAHLFLVSQVSPYFIHPKDFASDILVQKLTSYSTLKILDDAISDRRTFGKIEDTGGLGCTLFFVRLHLHAVSGRIVPPKYCALYLWTSIIWFMSLYGVNITPKRNLLYNTIVNEFLVLQYDL